MIVIPHILAMVNAINPLNDRTIAQMLPPKVRTRRFTR